MNFQILIKLLSLMLVAGCSTSYKSDDTSYVTQYDSSYLQMREDYIKGYSDLIVVDTSVMLSNTHVNLNFKYYCAFDSLISIPPEYNWGGDNREFVTHNFKADINLTSSDQTTSIKIDKTIFKELLSDELSQYGVLLYPNFRGILGDELVIHFSISIPLTDVGTSVLIFVMQDGSYRVDKS